MPDISNKLTIKLLFVGVSNSLTVKTTITDILLVTLGSIKYVDVSHFINSQQHHYASHVIRMNASRSLKMLAFNDDQYKKKGRPTKSLIDQVVGNFNMTLSQYCSLALSKKSGRST